VSARLWRPLAGIAVALPLLVGGLAIASPGADWLKPRLAGAVQRATGRALTIQGRLRIGWDLTLDAGDVGFANMPGGSQPMMAQVGRIHARLALWPLFHGQLRVAELRLTDPQILLERDAAGVVNWQMQRPTPAVSSGSSPVRPGSRWEFRFDRLTTDGGVLRWHDARNAVADGQRPMPAISADFTAGGKSGVVDLATTLGSEPLHATASIGSELLRGADAPFRMTMTLAGATATASGKVAPNGNGIGAAVAVRAPDLARLAALGGRALPGPGPLSLDAQANVTRQGLTLAGLRVAAPPGDVAGNLTWIGGERPSLVADLTAQRLDLAALRAMAAALRPPAAPQATAAPAPTPAPPTAHIISDRPLPFGDLDRLDADVRLRVATLANPDLRDLATRLLVRDGRLALDPFAANAGGKLDGSLQIDLRQAVPAVSMTLHAPSLALPSLLRLARLPVLADGAASLDANLHATGRTPHELAATLTGTAHIASAGATLDGAAFVSLLSAAHLPPVGGRGEARLRCVVAGFDAAAGQVTVMPLLLDSGRVSLQGEGHVDLDTETLAMQLRPMLRTGPGITIPLRLTGGWRTLKLSSDLGGALGTAGSDPCVATPPPAAPGKGKRPKPIDILRGLLR